MRRFLARKQSLLIAITIAVVVTLWVASGELATGAAPDATVAKREASDRLAPFSVRVAELRAEPVSRTIVISGRTEPSRTVTLRAETDGRVVATQIERGARVRDGDVVVQIDVRDRRSRLREARSLVTQRELEFAAAQKLQASNFQTETAVAEALANLDAARARVEQVQIEIANTSLRAPFDGLLEERPVEIGDYVNDGSEVARVLDVDPLVVIGAVTQQERPHIELGDVGQAHLFTGETLEGRVRYLSAESDEATRTYQVELEIPNADGVLSAGVSTEIHIHTEPTAAHRISSALLSLDATGRLGVKGLDREDHPVKIMRAEAGGVWVTGLPDPVRVITVGQGFVRAGELVLAVPDEGYAAEGG